MDKQISENFKKLLPFWDSLTKASQQAVLSSVRKLSFKKDEFISASHTEGLIVLKHGRMCVYLLAENGREMTLFHLNAEDSCVLTAEELFPLRDIDIHIQVEVDSEFYVIPTNVVKELITKHSSVGKYLFTLTTSAYATTLQAVQRNFFYAFSTRLALFLLEEKRTTMRNNLYITHESIARHIGSSREVVSRELKKLAATGAIEVSRGRVILRDIDKLEMLANSKNV